MRLPDLMVSSIIITLSLLCSGCAGTFGLTTATVTDTPKARIVDVQSFGFEVRTRRFDAGGNLGYRHSVYLFPPAADGQTAATRHHLFFVPAEGLIPLGTLTCNIGLEAGFTPVMTGFDFGYVERWYSALPVNQSRAVRINYERHQPSSSVVELLE